MKTFAWILLAIALLAAYNAVFVVREGQSAIVLQFGRIERTNDKPGLHFKIPFVQQAMHASRPWTRSPSATSRWRRRPSRSTST